MIRVTVELIPFGNELLKKTLGEISIINNGRGNEERGYYDIRVVDFENQRKETGFIYHFYRKKGFWSLLKEVLKAIDYAEV
jgi:hypothetical protein